MNKKQKFLLEIYETILENPDWYIEAVSQAGLGWMQYKKDLEGQIVYTQMALAMIPKKDAQRLQKNINRDLWPKPIQQIIDLRAEGKNLSDIKI